MGEIYRESIVIKSHETDSNGRLSIPMLVRLLLYVSNRQTERLGNTCILQEKGLTWFILQHDLTIHQMPKVDDTITVETEALSYNKFFTYRRFKVFINDTVFVETVMKFALVDMIERKLVRIDPKFVNVYKAERLSTSQKMTKIKRLDVCSDSQEYSIRQTDIDMNQHVNNAVYLEWIWKSLPNIYHDKLPKHLAIIYENEVRSGKVQHYCQNEEKVTYHVIKAEDLNLARAVILWEYL
ncbi:MULTISPECIES: acyl-[acyl-carrier-protein] thioesterase [unclassified Granulicatella]|uniref:acyl-[acyl-carrier-protein] thioesterase n=1 Tax=unclassified Granulicatella TaxID=2630493 RepID=UPI001430D455|nr:MULTISPECIES: acyl-ACP thioesterase domain-containing protein [unclassified Granulicatella]MBF0780449.1 hypothetical protein [Granulicatella sp. 19428wC4_WM01]